MDLAKIIVGFGEQIFVNQEALKTVRVAQLEIIVHFNGVEWADFHTNLAAHANRNIDIEDAGLKLHLADEIGFFDAVLDDVDALRGTFLLANLARHATEPRLWISAVIDQKWKVAGVLFEWLPFLRILHRHQPVFFGVTADKVPGRFSHAFEDSGAKHTVISDLLLPIQYRRCPESQPRPPHYGRCTYLPG